MKTSPIFFLLCLGVFSTTAFSASRNLCDDLVDSGAAAESIKKCQDKFGVSEHAKERALKDSLKKDQDELKKTETAKSKDNIEVKKFTAADLGEAGFGKPFYALRYDYRNRKIKEKRITEGDALCKYLGYEKALKSIVSPEIMPNDADKNGLVVDTTWYGGTKSEPELYRDEDLMFTVRKYTEITCAKVKDSAISGSQEVLKSMTEDLIVINELMSGPRTGQDLDVDNGQRKAKDGSATFGYKVPDWAKDDKKGASTTGK
jgi:hypothetical protein